MPRKSLAIVGAGAKAAAIVARAAVLKDILINGSVPDIHVFEEHHIGAAWDGHTGHSSGFLTLCTPGEKDVGFPYQETRTRRRYKRPPAGELHARFSWQAYLVAKGQFAEWVDRGRDHPDHSRWAAYLKWVFKQAATVPVFAEVTRIAPAGSRWTVDYSGKSSGSLEVDGVVVTGTGRARAVPCEVDVPPDRVFDSEDVWENRKTLLALQEGTIAVAGNGGAAGAIVAWLVTHLAERDVRILNVNPLGTLFVRGDGYAERRWFTDPSEWDKLTVDHRREILAHTEAGVVSTRNKQIIDQSPMVDYRRGKAQKVRMDGAELAIDIAYDGQPAQPERVDYLISAIGFDRWSLLDTIDAEAATSLCSTGSEPQRREVLKDMLDDLSLPPLSGLPPGLHIPALAEFAQGPGMGNLGCLGLMARAILQSYS